MNRKEEYEKYMKQITDGFIDMQLDIICGVGHKSEKSTGYKIVIWDGGINYKMGLDGGLYISGMTMMEEAKEYNAKIALKYLHANSLTYNEWLKKY